MADTVNFSWTLPTINGDEDQWGAKLNDAITAIDAALKGVKDTADGALPLSGGSVTGDIDMGGSRIASVADATNALDAVSRAYGDARYFRRGQDVDLQNSALTGLAAPSTNSDAATKSYTDGLVNALQTSLSTLQASVDGMLDKVYPIGSLYFNGSDNRSPSTILGFGTWEKKAGGRVLVGQGGGYSLGSTGGSANTTLSQNQLPDHQHHMFANVEASSYTTLTGNNQGASRADVSGNSNSEYFIAGVPNVATIGRTSEVIGASGAQQSVSLEQPYIVVQIWERTA
ncbi:MAG: hypothetical protein AAFX52_11135 [Pseudomonadota bacterium]